MSKIMFVCTGNICRSPMAEVMARDVFPKEGLEGYEFVSSGVAAMEGFGATDEVAQVLGALKLDVSKHRARYVSAKDIDACSHVFAMTRAHLDALLRQYPKSRDKIHLLSEYASSEGDVHDPYMLGLGAYEECREVLMSHLLAVAKRLREE